ncbi:hypothetical protein [Duganella vulcania]|uniref:Uncharacterized protein n=1 Tax=Duganella vulcania TaxID=2692166 RepID=A0A845GH05_9BURK|nr:hypothetical protein [Duganella vulcania]MYM92685.1 hypothetical protein [Duganella vulcania]
MSPNQFLQQLAQCEGSVSVSRGVVSFPDGESFDLASTLSGARKSLASVPDAAFDLQHVEAVPGKTLPKDFAKAVALLERPYLPIGEPDYRAIMAMTQEANTDIVLYQGRQMTFGNADGGYALMPLATPL